MRRLALGLLALLLAGCSQAAALAPVGGSRPTQVRFAAIDVLLDHHTAVLVAPVCTRSGDDVSCTGSTVDHRIITVTAPASDKTRMTVVVGATTVFDGAFLDVLDAHARSGS